MNIVTIRTAVANKLSPLDIHSYDYTPNVPIVPAAYIYPDPFSYHLTFTGGGELTEAKFVVRLIVATVNNKGGQAALDALIAPTGTGSAVAAIEADTTLGGVVSSTEVTGMRNYGVLTIPGADGRFFSAELILDVLCS